MGRDHPPLERCRGRRRHHHWKQARNQLQLVSSRPGAGDGHARSTLLPKSVRVLSGREATALGGRGEFTLVAVRPPSGASAWTEVVVAFGSAEPDAVLVLEVGGEVSTVAQVLESIFLAPTGRGVERLSLAPRALLGRPGVPVIRVPRGQPVSSINGTSPWGADGVAFLVTRSPVDVLADGATTTSGRADLAWDPTGDWRVGDRVVIRLPLARLRTMCPASSSRGRTEASSPRTRLPGSQRGCRSNGGRP